MEEKTVWKGNASHVINFGVYLLCGLLFFLVVPLFIILWKWLENRSRVYEVTTERLRTTEGIFTKRTEELELYRVKDTTLVEPFLYRSFGAGNIVISTTDETNPILELRAIKDAAVVREEIRKNAEICRDRKRVRVSEFD